MTTGNKTTLTKDPAKRKIFVVREFNAPLDQIWNAWTDSKILDSWWAPKPWKAQTKRMDFREGGSWLYCMVGPDGTQAWSKAEYTSVVPMKKFEGDDYFCDENGKKNSDMPGMHWNVRFSSAGSGTKVEVEITFSSEADLAKIIEMGFEEGFSAAHGNLDEVLARQQVVR